MSLVKDYVIYKTNSSETRTLREPVSLVTDQMNRLQRECDLTQT